MKIIREDCGKTWTSKCTVGIAGLVLLLALPLTSEFVRAFGAEEPAAVPKDQADKSNAPRVANDYIIGPSNVLAINVWKDTELSRTVLVRPDGRISLPLIGELEVSGLTAGKVQDLIAQRLSPYISKPQVTVIVTEVKSRTYTVVGKIAKPGSFELGKPTTVLDAIAIAGGFLDFAKVSKIYVIRRLEDGSETRLPFDYKKVIKGQKTDENINLKSGDTIVVP